VKQKISVICKSSKFGILHPIWSQVNFTCGGQVELVICDELY